MRRWNGWGDSATTMELPAHGTEFLQRSVGRGQVLPDASLDQVMAQVPPSRLPAHPLVSRRMPNAGAPCARAKLAGLVGNA